MYCAVLCVCVDYCDEENRSEGREGKEVEKGVEGGARIRGVEVMYTLLC